MNEKPVISRLPKQTKVRHVHRASSARTRWAGHVSWTTSLQFLAINVLFSSPLQDLESAKKTRLGSARSSIMNYETSLKSICDHPGKRIIQVQMAPKRFCCAEIVRTRNSFWNLFSDSSEVIKKGRMVNLVPFQILSRFSALSFPR